MGLHGYTLFSLFCSKILVRSEAVLTCTSNLCFEQKYEKSPNISTENCHFYSRENRCMLHGRVFVMCSNWKGGFCEKFQADQNGLEIHVNCNLENIIFQKVTPKLYDTFSTCVHKTMGLAINSFRSGTSLKKKNHSQLMKETKDFFQV